MPIPWESIGRLFKGGLLTPKDYASYFKNILHAGLLLRSKQAFNGSTMCRCCGAKEERFKHLASCGVLIPVWVRFRDLIRASPESLGLAKEPLHARLILLGVTWRGQMLPMGLLALWVLLWKFMIVSFTQVDTEGKPFSGQAVWKQAVRRMVTRVHAAVHVHRLRMQAAESCEGPLPSPARLNGLLEGLASVNDTGKLTWLPAVQKVIMESGVKLDLTQPAVTPRPAAPKPTLLVATKRRVPFVRATEEGEAPLTAAPIAVTEHDRYAWPIVREMDRGAQSGSARAGALPVQNAWTDQGQPRQGR